MKRGKRWESECGGMKEVQRMARIEKLERHN